MMLRITIISVMQSMMKTPVISKVNMKPVMEVLSTDDMNFSTLMVSKELSNTRLMTNTDLMLSLDENLRFLKPHCLLQVQSPSTGIMFISWTRTMHQFILQIVWIMIILSNYYRFIERQFSFKHQPKPPITTHHHPHHPI